MKTAFVLIAWCGLLAIVPPEFVHAENVEAGIEAILKSEKGGAGHAAAVPALKQLGSQQATALVPILRGMAAGRELVARRF